VVPGSVVMLGHCCDGLGLIFGLGRGAWRGAGVAGRAGRGAGLAEGVALSLVMVNPAPAAGCLPLTLCNRAPGQTPVQINRMCMHPTGQQLPALFLPNGGSGRDYQELPAISNPTTAEQAGARTYVYAPPTLARVRSHAADGVSGLRSPTADVAEDRGMALAGIYPARRSG
jgi:hypothetical protein